ncbi:uncharacterized protein LOC118438397 [Folsomia candida]|uniref:uncharacterized protein LOC118438397 n=1 Tax=Folsomia candida TaxID=158441 RepID=UPI00160523D4|nr:uncharacterized protein LOC118438397 [Folsomia candida]
MQRRMFHLYSDIAIRIFILVSFHNVKSSVSGEDVVRVRVPKDLKSANLQNSKGVTHQEQEVQKRSGRLLPSPKVYRCGDIGREMVINFVNEQYPRDDEVAGECNFRLVIQSHDICQVRVDLVDTVLLPPTRGECLSQTLTVEGALWPTGLSPICGVNNDQHFYLHLEPWGGNTSLIDFKVVSVLKGKPYRFGIWLTQMDCAAFNVLKAPEGCTQFFLSEVGTIKSFNFEGGRYLNGQNYQICIRSGKGVCGIRYDSAPGEFRVKKSITAPKEMLLRSGAGTTACGQDFVMIPDGHGTTVVNLREKRLLFRRRRPATTTKPNKRRSPVAAAVNKRKLELLNSQDRFCGGTLSPSGGETVNKPVFARVRSNLISLRIKTSPYQEYKKKMEAMNLTSGFHLKYSQIRNCDDHEEEIDMVSLASQVQTPYNVPIIVNKHPTSGITGGMISSSSNAFFASLLKNGTYMDGGGGGGGGGGGIDRGDDLAEDDAIWEYLESDEETGDDDDVYDYFD